MTRHTFKEPKGKIPRPVITLIGIFAALAVFLAIPLSQKLGEIFQPDVVEDTDFDATEPPDESMVEEEQKPPEEEEEPPPEMEPDPQEAEASMEAPALEIGTGGGMVLNIPKFNVKEGAGVFDSGDLDQPPRAVTKFPPQYPSSMRRKGIVGRVVVRVRLSAAGSVVDSSIKSSSGHVALDRAAEEAVRKWRFKPGIKGGKKVQSICNIPINFKLNR